MADDRMKNDDLQKNMGGAGRDEGQDLGQQSPGRTGQNQQGGGKQAGGYGGSSQQQGTNEFDMEDDDLGAGNAQTGGQGRGGQNR